MNTLNDRVDKKNDHSLELRKVRVVMTYSGFTAGLIWARTLREQCNLFRGYTNTMPAGRNVDLMKNVITFNTWIWTLKLEIFYWKWVRDCSLLQHPHTGSGAILIKPLSAVRESPWRKSWWHTGAVRISCTAHSAPPGPGRWQWILWWLEGTHCHCNIEFADRHEEQKFNIWLRSSFKFRTTHHTYIRSGVATNDGWPCDMKTGSVPNDMYTHVCDRL